jgi:hypothetical protein
VKCSYSIEIPDVRFEVFRAVKIQVILLGPLKCSLPIEIPDARYDRILRRRIFKPRSST